MSLHDHGFFATIRWELVETAIGLRNLDVLRLSSVDGSPESEVNPFCCLFLRIGG
jgi:hypothetical protein